MTKFVLNANLPKQTNRIIIGEKYSSDIGYELNKYDIEVLELPANPFVDRRLSSHADLSVLHAGGDTLLLSKHLRNSSLEDRLLGHGFDIIYPDVEQSSAYPNDTFFNVCVFGANAISYNNSLGNPIVNYLTSASISNLIFSKQGYARCSVCIVNENAIITSDRGIYKAAKASCIDVLLISPGYITLDGFDYGFIGGASFKLASDTIAFTGNLNLHPDKESILSFIRAHEVTELYLTDRPIFDIGSGIQITER